MRITNANYAGGSILLFGVLIPAGCAFIWWAILDPRWHERSGSPDWAFRVFIGGPALLAAIVCPIEVARQTVLWLEIGPRLRYCTLLGIRSVEWSQVRRWTVTDEETKLGTNLPFVHIPIGVHRVLSVELGPCTDLRVKIAADQEPRVRDVIARWHPKQTDANRGGNTP
jgi:hypothetical protein